MPPKGGDRGDWLVARPRWRKALQQVEDRRDRLREEQRHGGSRRHGQSRVRDLCGSTDWDSDTEDSDAFCDKVLTHDGCVVLQYSRPGRYDGDGVRKSGRRSQVVVPRSFSRQVEARLRVASVGAEARAKGNQRWPSRQPGRVVREQKDGAGTAATHDQNSDKHAAFHDVLRQATAVQHGTVPNSITFYFSNVPNDISYSSLRKGFEVCGIMEDIYLARKRNVNGAVFGFVRYSKVKDVDKLLKAVNNVWLGDYKVVAKVSTYDRNGNKRGDGKDRGEGGKNSDGEKRRIEGEKRYEGEKREVVGQARGVGGGGTFEEQGEGFVYGGKKVSEKVNVDTVFRGTELNKQCKQVYIPKYSSSVNDVTWASKGMVVSVLNGDAIPVLQRRIFDAGFEKLVLIPLGADKVFLRLLDDGDVSRLLSEAAEFFNNFFSKPVRWNKDMLFRKRGAWVRIYGVPLHAWNIDFFKLCLFDCGNLLRIDDITVDRDRFDYARILVSTSSLEIINTKVCVMVDGVLLDCHIIEELDFSLGEDACLLDEEGSLNDVNFERPEAFVEDVDCGFVNDFLNHLSENLNKEVMLQQGKDMSLVEPVPVNVNYTTSTPTDPLKPQGVENILKISTLDPVTKEVLPTGNCNDGAPQGDEDVGVDGSFQSRGLLKGENRVVKRTSSCPPARARSTSSSPWSLDFLNSRKQNAYGVPVKTKRNDSDTCYAKVPKTKKKGSGYLRHCAQNLKRIARLSDKDRKEVLRALQRSSKQRKAVSNVSKAMAQSKEGSFTGESQPSVNND